MSDLCKKCNEWPASDFYSSEIIGNYCDICYAKYVGIKSIYYDLDGNLFIDHKYLGNYPDEKSAWDLVNKISIVEEHLFIRREVPFDHDFTNQFSGERIMRFGKEKMYETLFPEEPSYKKSLIEYHKFKEDESGKPFFFENGERVSFRDWGDAQFYYKQKLTKLENESRAIKYKDD